MATKIDTKKCAEAANNLKSLGKVLDKQTNELDSLMKQISSVQQDESSALKAAALRGLQAIFNEKRNMFVSTAEVYESLIPIIEAYYKAIGI